MTTVITHGRAARHLKRLQRNGCSVRQAAPRMTVPKYPALLDPALAQEQYLGRQMAGKFPHVTQKTAKRLKCTQGFRMKPQGQSCEVQQLPHIAMARLEDAAHVGIDKQPFQ